MKKFITFEGIDGSGKSTVIKKVHTLLKKEENDVILTFEPTDTWIGKQVQKCIETGEDPYITAFTFIADRIMHGKQIKKWLDEEKIVLCDRYAESTYAYQGAQLEKEIDKPIKWLQDMSKNKFPTPHRTFLFVIDPKDSLARIQNRDKLIPFEKINFLEKVHHNYMSLGKGKRFKKIDATKSIEEIVKICLEDIKKKIV